MLQRYLRDLFSLTQTMWKDIDWFYVIFAVGVQLGAILLATQPAWFFFRTVIANTFYMLPWAIALNFITVTPGIQTLL